MLVAGLLDRCHRCQVAVLIAEAMNIRQSNRVTPRATLVNLALEVRLVAHLPHVSGSYYTYCTTVLALYYGTGHRTMLPRPCDGGCGLSGYYLSVGGT
jgi:hypothetical protein